MAHGIACHVINNATWDHASEHEATSTRLHAAITDLHHLPQLSETFALPYGRSEPSCLEHAQSASALRTFSYLLHIVLI